MSSGRKILAERLNAGLPTRWLVISTARGLDAITRPTVILWTSKRKRNGQLTLSLLQDEIELWVFDPTESPELIEDALDDRLLEVIEVLEQNPEFAWEEAERGTLTLDERTRFSGWKIPLTCIYKVEGS